MFALVSVSMRKSVCLCTIARSIECLGPWCRLNSPRIPHTFCVAMVKGIGDIFKFYRRMNLSVPNALRRGGFGWYVWIEGFLFSLILVVSTETCWL